MKKKQKLNILFGGLVFLVLGATVLFWRFGGKNQTPLTSPTPTPSSQPNLEELNEEKLPEGYDYEEKTGGSLGGFFFLKDITWGRHEDFERVVITVLPQNKNPLPFYKISLKDNNKDPLPDSENGTIDKNLVKDLGEFRLEVYISDISAYDISQMPPKQIYTKGDLNVQSDYISKIKVYYPKEDNTLIILIGLKEKTPFKTTALKDPSRIILDLRK